MRHLKLPSLICGVLLSATITKAAYGMTVEDLSRGLRAREDGLQTFSFRIDYETEKTTDLMQLLATGTQGKLSRQLFHELYVFDGKRLRLESGNANSAPSLTNAQEIKNAIGTFDGSVGRTLTGADGEWSQGQVTESLNDMPWNMDPRELLTTHGGILLSSVVSELGAKTVKVVGKDDRTLLRVDGPEYPLTKNETQKLVLIVDPDRSFATTSRLVYTKLAPSEEWFLSSEVTIDNFIQLDTGIWVPTRGTRGYSVGRIDRKTGKYDVQPVERSVIKFSEWQSDPDVSDKVFTVEFPPSIVVDDRITGTHYVTAKNTARTLSKHLRDADAVAHPKHRLRSVFVIINIGICIAIAIALVNKRRRAS